MSEAPSPDELPRRMESSQTDLRMLGISRTHDKSFTDCHVRDIEKLGADLNEAVQAAWPKRHSIRYSQVHVLLLSWEADDLGVEAEIGPLRRLFEDRYHFSVEEYKIPSIKPDRALKQRVLNFLEGDDLDILLIVYYAGHARGALQSNEASLWFANRNDPLLVAPSGGIQSLLEEADADVILLCDCCHSTAIPTTDSPQRKNNKVMEAITACGYEAIAAEVGDHSFTKALIHNLALASTGRPFTISELHARVVSKLKCYAPELRKGEDGNYIDTAENRLLFEQQPRRTPIFTVVCRSNPTRSIIIAPLGTIYPSPSESGEESTSHASGKRPEADMDIDDGGECKKRKRPIDDEGKFPFILVSARLNQPAYNKQAWVEWVRNAPDGAKDVHVEGAYDSFSTLLLLRMPAAVWNLLPSNPAYTFIGYVTSDNYAIPKRCDCTSAELCEICGTSAFLIPEETTDMDTAQTDTPQNEEFESVSMSRPWSQSASEMGSMAESAFSHNADLDSIWSKSSVAPSLATSRVEREGQPSNTGSASYTGLDTSPSYSASPHNPYNIGPRTPSLATETASSFRDLSLDHSGPEPKTSSSAGPSLPNSRNANAVGVAHRSSTMSAAPFTQGFRSSRLSADKHSHREVHKHHSSHHSSGHRTTPSHDTYEWFWYCHICEQQGPMSLNIIACPDYQCNHWRCPECRTEKFKIRAAA